MEWQQLDEFTQGFVEAMFFTGVPEDMLRPGQFTDTFDVGQAWANLSDDDRLRIVKECGRFQKENADNLLDYPIKEAGNDFLYTRNKEGVGFWECDHGTEAQCEMLSKACEKYGAISIERAEEQWRCLWDKGDK